MTEQEAKTFDSAWRDHKAVQPATWGRNEAQYFFDLGLKQHITDQDNYSFDQYQEEALVTAVYHEHRGCDLVYPILSLAGEVGELCNTLKKHLRGDDCGHIPEDKKMVLENPASLSPHRRELLLKEYRGALWYMAAIADELGTTMAEQAKLNIEELKGRKERGTIKGTGDNR